MSMSVRNNKRALNATETRPSKELKLQAHISGILPNDIFFMVTDFALETQCWTELKPNLSRVCKTLNEYIKRCERQFEEEMLIAYLKWVLNNMKFIESINMIREDAKRLALLINTNRILPHQGIMKVDGTICIASDHINNDEEEEILLELRTLIQKHFTDGIPSCNKKQAHKRTKKGIKRTGLLAEFACFYVSNDDYIINYKDNKEKTEELIYRVLGNSIHHDFCSYQRDFINLAYCMKYGLYKQYCLSLSWFIKVYESGGMLEDIIRLFLSILYPKGEMTLENSVASLEDGKWDLNISLPRHTEIISKYLKIDLSGISKWINKGIDKDLVQFDSHFLYKENK